MKVIDKLDQPRPARKPIELIHCMQSSPDSNKTVYFTKGTDGYYIHPSWKSITRVARVDHHIARDPDGDRKFDVIMVEGDYFNTMLFLGYWNDGFVK